jgi:DNA polymerase-3 subunit chi
LTNISFYKLAGDQNLALALICQLVKKAHKQDQQVLCLMPGQSEVISLDKAMWASEPHGTGVESSPIAVSCDAEPGDHHQVLINLQPEIPTWFSRFDRVIEIIYQDSNYEQSKRDNFVFYRERGYPISYHDLTDKFKP